MSILPAGSIRSFIVAGLLAFSPGIFGQSVESDEAPVFTEIAEQSIDAGQLLELRVMASKNGDQPPWLSIDSPPYNSDFADNGDGTRTFRWWTSVEDLGEHVITFVAANSSDLTQRSTLDVVVNVLPVLDPGSDLRIIAPQNFPISPGDFVSIIVRAIDSSGNVPSLFLTEDSTRSGATLDDNGDGSRTFNWQAPDPIITGGALGVSFQFEFMAVSATSDDKAVIHTLLLDYVPDSPVVPPTTELPSLILPNITSVLAGERITFRVAAVTASGQVANLTVTPQFNGVAFTDNGDGSRTFSWTTLPVDSGNWPFVFSAEDPADGAVTEELVVISVAG